MKIFKRLPRNFKAAVVFSVIFTLLFPFSLIAQTETQYKVPKNSLSYFLQNPSQSAYLETVTDEETGAVIPPLTAVDTETANLNTTAAANIEVAAAPAAAPVEARELPVIEEPAQTAKFNDYVAPAPEKIAVKAVDENLFTEAPPVASEKTEVAVVETAAPVKAEPEKIQPQQYQAKVNMTEIATSSDESAATTPEITSAPATGDEPVFSKVLNRMQQNKAKRVAEAEKLGLVLPSQGGDIAAVSPSLSKIQQTLKTIMAKHP